MISDKIKTKVNDYYNIFRKDLLEKVSESELKKFEELVIMKNHPKVIRLGSIEVLTDLVKLIEKDLEKDKQDKLKALSELDNAISVRIKILDKQEESVKALSKTIDVSEDVEPELEPDLRIMVKDGEVYEC